MTGGGVSSIMSHKSRGGGGVGATDCVAATGQRRPPVPLFVQAHAQTSGMVQSGTRDRVPRLYTSGGALSTLCGWKSGAVEDPSEEEVHIKGLGLWARRCWCPTMRSVWIACG